MISWWRSSLLILAGLAVLAAAAASSAAAGVEQVAVVRLGPSSRTPNSGLGALARHARRQRRRKKAKEKQREGKSKEGVIFSQKKARDRANFARLEVAAKGRTYSTGDKKGMRREVGTRGRWPWA